MTATLLRTAQEKFGEVLETREHSNGGTVFLIRRSEPARAAVPYMTIRGIDQPSGGVCFNWGRYDMTEKKAREDYNTR